MQVTLVGKRSTLLKKHCQALCGRPFLFGQSVLVVKLNSKDYADPSWAAHADCLRHILEAGPKGDIEDLDPRAALAARIEAAKAAGAS